MSSQRPVRRKPNEAEVTTLTILWEAADRICGKRLKAVLATFVESMEHHGHLCLDREVRERLLGMSAATIDRLLRPVRASAKRGRRRTSVIRRCGRVSVSELMRIGRTRRLVSSRWTW